VPRCYFYVAVRKVFERSNWSLDLGLSTDNRWKKENDDTTAKPQRVDPSTEHLAQIGEQTVADPYPNDLAI
jgi:hypothetical protein